MNWLLNYFIDYDWFQYMALIKSIVKFLHTKLLWTYHLQYMKIHKDIYAQ